MARNKLPRVVVAGLAGDTGKSFVALGLTAALRNRGLAVAPFKKGPDFIDAAWMALAAGRPGRNLDSFLMSEKAILSSVARNTRDGDIVVVEGNRGLFDGMDAQGSHSTAFLSRLIGAPVILVVNVTKATRTVAAQVLGCTKLEPDLEIAGVVLNKVGTSRQETVIRRALRDAVGIDVIGSIPRLRSQHLPSRHLGLVTACEHPDAEEALAQVTEAVSKHVNVDAVLDIAGTASPFEAPVPARSKPARRSVKIGVLMDRAFSFYYPENLEALEHEGAELLYASPLADEDFPKVDALYAGGGFPEVHGAELAANTSFKEQLLRAVQGGLPVWAECGGLMYLSRTLVMEGGSYPMVGALPVSVEHTRRPQGHGYVMARVDGRNPYFDEGTSLTGHEFHYSRLAHNAARVDTIMAVDRGVGLGKGRDGIVNGKVVAGYTHLHALGTPGWAERMVKTAAGEAA